MADSITDQEDLITYAMVTDNEIRRLSQQRDDVTAWARYHIAAWRFVKEQWLALRGIEEDDLYDSGSQFKEVCCYLALYFAYKAAENLTDEQAKRAKYWWHKARKTYAAVDTQNTAGVSYGRESFSSRRARRA